eukprot:gene11711-24542_t
MSAPIKGTLICITSNLVIINSFLKLTAIGVPIKLLHEAEGHVVTVELKNGEIYRGSLREAEDTMNCRLEEVTMTARDGRVTKLEQVFLRGGQVKFVVLPELLKNAPIFKKVQSMRSKTGDRDSGGRGRGRGRGGGRTPQNK